jgi:hypothetical protein
MPKHQRIFIVFTCIFQTTPNHNASLRISAKRGGTIIITISDL